MQDNWSHSGNVEHLNCILCLRLSGRNTQARQETKGEAKRGIGGD